jgi:hypothetical protein
MSWRLNALPPYNTSQAEDELEDTGTSPVKKPIMEMDDRESINSGVKRRLALENTTEFQEDLNDGNVPMITDGAVLFGENEEMDTEKERPKRSKKARANTLQSDWWVPLRSLSGRNEDIRIQLSGFG